MRSYLRLLRFAAPYKLTLAVAILCMTVLSLSTAAYVYLLGPALEFLFQGDPRALASLGRFVPASWDLAGKLARSTARPSSGCCRDHHRRRRGEGVAYFGQFFLMGMVGQRMVADVRRALFDHLLRLSPTFYTRRHSGDILQRFSADVLSVETAVSNAIPSYLRDGLTVIVMLVSCFVLDWRMSLVAFGAVPLTLLPVARLAKRLKRVTGHAQSTAGELSEMVQEAVSGMRVVQAYGMQRWESERFSEANRKLIRILRRSYLVRAFSSPLMEIMGAAGLAAAIWWVGGRILAGELEPGKFFSFVAAVLLLYTPVKQLGRVGQIAMQGAAAGDRIFEILDTPSAVPDDGRDLLAPFSDSIRYERVAFDYGQRPVLHELDLEIRKGEVVALVGASGGGKTTIANLLPRFWDVTSGASSSTEGHP